MSREPNRRGKKGVYMHHGGPGGRYGNSSPNFHRPHNNCMGADTPNWRDPVTAEATPASQQKAMLHQSYGEFLMKGWIEFEEEKKKLAARDIEVKHSREGRVDSDRSIANSEHRSGQNQARTTST